MDSRQVAVANWMEDLPVLAGRSILLREPNAQDVGALADLLSLPDSPGFGLDGVVSQLDVRRFIDRMHLLREIGAGVSFAVTARGSRDVVGLIQARQLEPTFELAEWDCVLAPGVRGSGAFVEAACLAGSFIFERIGAHRLEARVPVANGRANGALRKLGAVQEGILRRSLRRGHEYVDQVLWAVLKEDWDGSALAVSSRVH